MVSIKGRQDGLLVVLDEEQDWAAQIAELEAQLEIQKAFFAGARLALQVGGRPLVMSDIQDLQARLAQRDITLETVVSDSEATLAAARHLNLATDMASRQPPAKAAADLQEPPVVSEEGSWFIHCTLRSGQKIHHLSHVTVIGDVNPGAEIIAGGDVVVWGRLQGLVHAGAMGDDSAVVCALDLSPTQLRIGSYIARSPEEKRRRKVRPEMASVSEGRIVAEPWDDKKRGKK
jgi:septum site-determining protein MinC